MDAEEERQLAALTEPSQSERPSQGGAAAAAGGGGGSGGTSRDEDDELLALLEDEEEEEAGEQGAAQAAALPEAPAASQLLAAETQAQAAVGGTAPGSEPQGADTGSQGQPGGPSQQLGAATQVDEPAASELAAFEPSPLLGAETEQQLPAGLPGSFVPETEQQADGFTQEL